ncbi:MAG: hypothetical protein WBZ36_22085 [Candidatus Nitrosopolaris sp.]
MNNTHKGDFARVGLVSGRIVIAPPSPTNNPATTHQGRHAVKRSKSYFLSHFEIEYMDTTPLPVLHINFS